MSQSEINALLVERGRAGGNVVRLKGGDPFVFARGGEEAAALADAGVPFEIVPGISSAIAVPAYAGIPVTLRHSSTSFTVVTGHEDPAAGDDGSVDWRAVARVGGTIVILMGVARIGRIADELVAGGLDPSTPVAAVRWGTRPEQHTVRSTLSHDRRRGAGHPFGHRRRRGRRRRPGVVRATTAVRTAGRRDPDPRPGVDTLSGAARRGRGSDRGAGDRHRGSRGRRCGSAVGRALAGLVRLGRRDVPERCRARHGRAAGGRPRRPSVRRRPGRGDRSGHRRGARRRRRARRPGAGALRGGVAPRGDGELGVTGAGAAGTSGGRA